MKHLLKTLLEERGNRLTRALDKHVGICLIYLLKIFKKPRRGLHNPSRIGILQVACIGDSVLALGPLRELREKHPEAEILYFASKRNTQVMQLDGLVDKLVVLPITNLFLTYLILRKTSKVDVFLDFGSWPRITALYAFFSRARRRVGFKSKKQHRHLLFDQVVEHGDDVHEYENYSRLAESLGNGLSVSRKPYVPVDCDCAREAIGRLGLKKPYVVCHMFPGGYKSYFKEWPVENWSALISHLSGAGYNIVLTGAGYDRKEVKKLYPHIREVHGVYNLCGELDLVDVSYVLYEARFVVSVNTGIMHLAAAVGANIIALHGPTSPTRWGALGNGHHDSIIVNLKSKLRCSPCLNLGFEYNCNDNICMQNIQPREVINIINRHFMTPDS